MCCVFMAMLRMRGVKIKHTMCTKDFSEREKKWVNVIELWATYNSPYSHILESLFMQRTNKFNIHSDSNHLVQFGSIEII